MVLATAAASAGDGSSVEPMTEWCADWKKRAMGVRIRRAKVDNTILFRLVSLGGLAWGLVEGGGKGRFEGVF